MFIKVYNNGCPAETHKELEFRHPDPYCGLELRRNGGLSLVTIPLHSYALFSWLPSDDQMLVLMDIHQETPPPGWEATHPGMGGNPPIPDHWEDWQDPTDPYHKWHAGLHGVYDITWEYYEDDQVERLPDGTFKLKEGAVVFKTHEPGDEPYLLSFSSNYVTSGGAENFTCSEEDFEQYAKSAKVSYPRGSIWTSSDDGSQLIRETSSWVPYGGGSSTTVDFQYDKIPYPFGPGTEFGFNKVVQYIGPSRDGRYSDPDIPDPDIGEAVFRGDWIRVNKVTDEATGAVSYHWEILMHNAQVIEVASLKESNWTPTKAEDEGYRVYLVESYDEEILKPDGTSYEPPRYIHRNRGWYQIVEKLTASGGSYSPKQFEWRRVDDVWTSALVDEAWLEYSETNEGKEEKSANTLSVTTSEDQCTVKLRAVYSESYVIHNPTEPYHQNILTKLPIPVRKAQKRYEAATLSPYMSTDIEVELTTDGVWNETTGTYTTPPTMGIIKIPDGSITVSSVDMTLTYDYDDKNFGP